MLFYFQQEFKLDYDALVQQIQSTHLSEEPKANREEVEAIQASLSRLAIKTERYSPYPVSRRSKKRY
jgi:hypothetical protein